MGFIVRGFRRSVVVPTKVIAFVNDAYGVVSYACFSLGSMTEVLLYRSADSVNRNQLLPTRAPNLSCTDNTSCKLPPI